MNYEVDVESTFARSCQEPPVKLAWISGERYAPVLAFRAFLPSR